MQDSALLLVTGAGLSLVCVGVIVVGLLLLLRKIGFGSIPLLGALLGGDDEDISRPIRTSPKPDLRSIAQSATNDFDAALARHDAQSQAAQPATPAAIVSPANPPPFADAPPRLTTRHPSPNVDSDDDDLLGAVLDDNEL